MIEANSFFWLGFWAFVIFAYSKDVHYRYLKNNRAELVLRQLVKAYDGDDQTPGHMHRVPERWDNDGSVCDWCTAWNKAQKLVNGLDDKRGDQDGN